MYMGASYDTLETKYNDIMINSYATSNTIEDAFFQKNISKSNCIICIIL